MILDVDIERRENLSATIERETISVQNIDFFDVATNETDEVEDDVDIAIITLDISIDATNDCFDVERNVNIAIIANIAFEVNSASSLDVHFADSFRDEVNVDTAISIDVDFDDFFDARYFFVVSIQEHVEKYSQCFR